MNTLHISRIHYLFLKNWVSPQLPRFHFVKNLWSGFYKLISLSTAVLNHLVRMLMVVLIVIKIGFAHIRPLEVVSILIGVLKVNFTAWSNLTTVKNHLIGKTIGGLVVDHIEFVHIRPLYVVLILIGIFKVDFTAWSKLTAIGKSSGWKVHMRFSGYPYRVRPYSTTECDFHIDKRF